MLIGVLDVDLVDLALLRIILNFQADEGNTTRYYMNHNAISHIISHELTDDLLLLGLAQHLNFSELPLFNPVGLTRIIKGSALHC